MADNRQNPDASPQGRHAKRASRKEQASSGRGEAQTAPKRSAKPSVSGAQVARKSGSRTHRANAPVRSDYSVPAEPGAARYGKEIAGKKKGGPWRIVFWVALFVLVAALVALGVIAYGYWQGQDKYSTVAEEVFEAPKDIEAASLADVTIDWDALRAINPEVVGWIYVPDTRVSYPIVHTTDNDKYLTTDFLGEQSWLVSYGAIFLSAENAPDFSDANNIVYGHHMNDGSMFAQFADFRDAGTFNEHRTVYILTPEANYKLNTFSLVVVDASDPLAQPAFADANEMLAYVQDKMDRSVVKPFPADVTANSVSKMFAFVTCSDYTATDDRIVLFANVADSAVPANAAAPAGESAPGIDPEDAAAMENTVGEIA